MMYQSKLGGKSQEQSTVSQTHNTDYNKVNKEEISLSRIFSFLQKYMINLYNTIKPKRYTEEELQQLLNKDPDAFHNEYKKERGYLLLTNTQCQNINEYTAKMLSINNKLIRSDIEDSIINGINFAYYFAKKTNNAAMTIGMGDKVAYSYVHDKYKEKDRYEKNLYMKSFVYGISLYKHNFRNRILSVLCLN